MACDELSPVELLRDCLAGIQAANPRINALVTLEIEGAMEAARRSEARQRAGARLGPLDGMPLSIKDNLFVRGLRATWGSRLYADFVPDRDDAWVERLRAAGAVIVAKSNTPEFSMGIQTDNLVFGATRNPWALDRVPGGSSGGAAASVAAGMLPLAIGTDAGGSIRLPASFNGVAGLKPSAGRIARVHGFPPIVADFQVIGLIATTVEGVRMLLSALAGADVRDRASLAFEAPRPPAKRTLRVGVIDRAGGEPVEPEVLQALRDAADAMSRDGFAVEATAACFDLAELKRFWSVLSPAGVARVVARFPQSRHAEITPAMAAVARDGAAIPATRYVEALDALAAFRVAVASRFMHDLLLTPTSPALPWKIGEAPPALIDGRAANARTPLAFNTFANATGYPAISVPWSASRDGLPIGVQLVAGYRADEALLDAALRLERLSPWHNGRRPPLPWTSSQPPTPS